ncbi:MAG: GAF domain-containing protein, partial [Actinomycetota bacterium]|nr:GAF domain-containing protein [Actinomycetota bacterium]
PHAADEFARWARLIAAEVVSDFASLARDGAGSGVDEPRRQSAVDRLGLTDSGADPRLRHITDMARLAFGTRTALFTVLDRDIQLHAARSGIDVTRIARGDSFCQYTILERGGMIVEDALNDDRFRENPLVTGEPHIRFYAGFPVDSPDGERVGALCIFDSSPRRADQVDTSLLRELAHLVQRELWRYLPETAAPDSRLRLLARSWTLPRPAPLHRVLRIETDGS